MADQTQTPAAAPRKEYKPFSRAIVVARAYENRNTGKMAVQLYAVSGKVPNANIIAVEVAKNAGFELGKKYEVDILEGPADEYGRQFRFNYLGEFVGTASAAEKEYGPANLITVRGAGAKPANAPLTEIGDNDILTLANGDKYSKSTGQLISKAEQPQTEEPKTEEPVLEGATPKK